jgi:hypothetical protein
VLVFCQSYGEIRKMFVFYKNKYRAFAQGLFASFFGMAVYSKIVQIMDNAQIGQINYTDIHVIKTYVESQ